MSFMVHRHVRKVRVLAIACFLLLAGGCSTLVQVPVREGASTRVSLAEAERGYARVLATHVNERGEVDFAGLRDDASEGGLRALERYVQAIAIAPLNVAPISEALRANVRLARLAHMINAYNALSMYNVIASGIPASHNGFAKVRFFLLRKFEIGGEAMSLYAFENDIIRKLDEPRAHFALNCSAVSCPVLPRAPFTAENLNDELDRETKKFFARPENLRIDREKRVVYFNEILKFYTEDFTPRHAPSLIAYAQRYTSETIPSDYAIAFSPYDWTIAKQRH
jgi:Protein of unknown function, DUF547